MKKELPMCILVEDLGMMYATETSNRKVRFGIYECGFCGTHFKTSTDGIKNGHTKSCGCYRKSQVSKANITHGGKGTKLYNIWCTIKARTTNENNKRYPDYGGRGIKMCEEWIKDFTKFRDWALANGYEEDSGLSIDRIDNDFNYEPNNCRWTTTTIQARNQRMRNTNTSGYRGVCFVKSENKFRAYICVDKKQISLGCFKTAVEAGIAYNNYIIENNLEGFNLNVIPEQKGENK